jgi:predicted ATPase/DNA-binding winged helix-turn-helix (wHTH) protein
MRQKQPDDAPAIRIEPDTGWAWRGGERLELTPKAFAVLRHLVEHPEHLITKDELLAAAWGDTVVSEAALTSCIRDLRKALDDSSRRPRYIETVHRRGFRFIGPVGLPSTSAPAPRPGPANVQPCTSTLVGRDGELARLHALLATAAGGQRRLVLVTGEAGIGKTALVETFLAQLGHADGLRIGRGQCVEQYGATEPYLPVLEALGRMGREPRGEALPRVLKQYAPTWLAQLPALLTDDELDAVQRRAQGTTRERMLRELSEALDAFSMEAPLVLLLEDLHWSDAATIDLLAMLARRRDAARLLILGTYRPADVEVGAHPLKPMKHELQLHGDCEELALEFLTEEAVGEYLAGRFPRASFPPQLARVLHENTSGNPLFMLNVIDDWIVRGHVRQVDGRWALSLPVGDIASGVPHTLWQMVEKQIERLAPHEQAVLAVASLAGADFSAALTTADRIDARDGERCCAELARRGQFLRAIGVAEWPDGTVAGRYAFIHALYRNVLYARVPIGHRVGLHLRIGAQLEGSYGDRAADIAGELAIHFEHGRDFARSVQYRKQAGEHALRQHGYREAAQHLTRAIHAVKAVPDSQERRQQELVLQVMLGSALTALEGHAAGDVEQAYARARELCEQVEDTPRLFPVFLGLGWFYILGGSLDAARDVGKRLARMAQASPDPAIGLAAHNVLGVACFYGGEFEAALDHFERGIALYDPAAHSPVRSSAFRNVLDAGVSCLGHAGWTLWMLGYPDRAAARVREAGALADTIEHPFTTAHEYRFAAGFHLSRRESGAVRECADASVAVATEHGFGAVLKAATFLQGWALADHGGGQEGMARMRDALAACRDIRAELLLPAYLAWLAEVEGEIGRPDEGLAHVSEGFATSRRSGCHYWTAELHRLEGTLALESRGAKASESSLREALTIARRQRAKSLELRAAMSLGRLWRKQRRGAEAHALLSEAYQWFTEGFETPDLRKAKALLEEHGPRTSGRLAP